MKIEHKRAVIYLGTGFVLMVFLGLIYGWSVFVTPLENEFGWSRADTSLIFTISMITFCIGSITGGVLNRKVRGNWLFLLVAVLEFIGFYMSSSVTQLHEIYFYYGVICGFATGVGYNTVVSMITPWFPNATGMVSGTLMMGYGLGAFVLGTVATMLINTAGWRFAFKLLAFSFAAVILLAALIIQPCKKVIPSGAEEKKTEEKGYTALEMLKSPIFWKLYLWQCLICAIGMLVIGNISPCSKAFGASEWLSVAAVGGVSVTNGIGRIICGTLFDKVGRMKTIKIVNITTIIGSICLTIGTGISNLYILIAGFVIIGFSYSCLAPYGPVFAKSVFGEKYYTMNFSILASAGIPASIIGSYVMGILIAKTNSYTLCFEISILIALAAYVVRFAIAKKIKD